jgi:LuxR family maltose regulon positive regulatory protein
VRVTNPTLLVIRAYLSDTIYYDYNAMGNYLKRASKYLEDHRADKRLSGAFASVHSCYSAQTNDLPNARKFAEQALKTLLPDQAMLRDYALNYKVMAASRLQDAAEATALVENLEFTPESASDRHLMRINVIKMLFYWDKANLKNLKQPGNIVTSISDHEKVWWMYKMGCYYLSQYYYLKNQISEVYSHIDAGIDCLFNAGPVWTLQLYYGGALAALAENDVPKAYSYLKSAKEFVEQKRLKSFQGYVRAFEVEFALKTNDIQKAWELNKSAKYSLHPPIKYYFIPQFTQVRLYIKKGDPDLMQEAYRLIQQHKKACEKIPYARIQITLLEAVWLAKSGLKERAVGALSQALALTLEEDYIRVFLDMGQPLKKLLAELPEDKKETPLVRNILMAFRYEPDTQDLISESLDLSSKETEILECVDRGMINKEIANRLFLSESTVKTYLYKIYQKLDVKNRTGALLKFRQSRSLQP